MIRLRESPTGTLAAAITAVTFPHSSVVRDGTWALGKQLKFCNDAETVNKLDPKTTRLRPFYWAIDTARSGRRDVKRFAVVLNYQFNPLRKQGKGPTLP